MEKKFFGNYLVAFSLLLLAACGGGGEKDSTKDNNGADNEKSEQQKPQKTTEPETFLGEISGPCGVLDDEEWTSTDSFIFRNTIDFGALEYDVDLLSAGGNYIATHDNAGGSSVESEAIAFEMLHRCEGAELLKIETEVSYQDPSGKITDILVKIDGRKVGVSVTRAFAYQRDYTLDDAEKLLEKKLSALPLSMENAVKSDRWERSMLSIIAVDSTAADQIEAAFALASAELKGGAIIMMTVSEGNDDFIY